MEKIDIKRVTLKTTPKGEKYLDDILGDGHSSLAALDLFEEAILKYIHNSSQHTLTFIRPLLQTGTKGVEALNYLTDNGLIEPV